MFWKKSKEKIRKIDILITTIVLWTIVSWAFWIKKHLNNQQQLPVVKKESIFVKFIKIILWKN